MGAAGCWLGLVVLLAVSDGCGLLEYFGSGAGGTDGVHTCLGKTGAGVGWGQGCAVGVAWGAITRGGEAVQTINRVSVVCRCGLLRSYVAWGCSIDWSQSLVSSAWSVMHGMQSVCALID